MNADTTTPRKQKSADLDDLLAAVTSNDIAAFKAAMDELVAIEITHLKQSLYNKESVKAAEGLEGVSFMAAVDPGRIAYLNHLFGTSLHAAMSASEPETIGQLANTLIENGFEGAFFIIDSKTKSTDTGYMVKNMPLHTAAISGKYLNARVMLDAIKPLFEASEKINGLSYLDYLGIENADGLTAAEEALLDNASERNSIEWRISRVKPYLSPATSRFTSAEAANRHNEVVANRVEIASMLKEEGLFVQPSLFDSPDVDRQEFVSFISRQDINGELPEQKLTRTDEGDHAKPENEITARSMRVSTSGFCVRTAPSKMVEIPWMDRVSKEATIAARQ